MAPGSLPCLGKTLRKVSKSKYQSSLFPTHTEPSVALPEMMVQGKAGVASRRRSREARSAAGFVIGGRLLGNASAEAYRLGVNYGRAAAFGCDVRLRLRDSPGARALAFPSGR